MRDTSRTPRFMRVLLGAMLATLVLGTLFDGGANADEPAKPKRVMVAKKTGDASAIYPTSIDRVSFSHSKHKGTTCQTCHASIKESKRASDRNTPAMEACATCHAQEIKPLIGDCAGCHQGHPIKESAGEASDRDRVTTPEQWRKVRPTPMILPAPQANLKFDHSAHAALDCQSCHDEDASKGGEPGMPSEASCQSCHDGKIAASACSTCHPTTKQGAVLKTDFADPVTGKQLTLRPSDHTVDWIQRHGPMAKTSSQECTSCHTESSCAECHQGSDPRSLLAAHPPNYIVLHRVAAKGQGSTCTSCHQQESTCLDCHMRSKATTIEGSKPPPRLAFHPPGWLEATNPSNHGVMARRNLNECASCHQERDCVSCHQGINPHPPDFRADCARMLRANPTPCLACHTNATCGM